jgi:flagellar biogenesis protein FliO
MPFRCSTSRIAFSCLALLPFAAAAQESSLPHSGGHLPSYDSHYARSRPLSVEAHPIDATRTSASPFPVRLAKAEELVPPPATGATAATLRLAPRRERTGDPIGKPVVPTPAGAVGTVAGGLGIVLGLFFVVAWATRRFTPAGSTLLPKEAVELLGRTPLAGRQQMQLVRVGNKLLLVALAPGSCETLTEITDAAEVEHLTALCRRGRPGSSSAEFQQVLSRLGSEPVRGGFAGPARPDSRGAA